MQRWMMLVVPLFVAGCAAPMTAERSESLFDDARFLPPSQRISAADVFAVNDAMKHYVHVEIDPQLRLKGRQQGLINALYTKGQLKLDYDGGTTRNAAQAFEGRSGNCLSLVIMTAALAKELDLSVHFQNVIVDDTWSRTGDVYFSIGHVNLTLGKKDTDVISRRQENVETTIDFLPPADIRGLRMREISEKTIVAMYMNNRAAESLADGRLDDAYWWAREAVGQDPYFLSAFNTLGAVYQRHADLAQAERTFRYVLAREPANTRTLSNLVAVLNSLGRAAEADVFAKKLAQIEPNPPFSYFDRGMVAMHSGDFKAARDLFAKEVERAAYYHEFQFWLAVASARLGELDQARKHLAVAVEVSTTRKDHDLYTAKLEWLRSYRIQ
jgi:Tfp pilus assembly protein PilF